MALIDRLRNVFTREQEDSVKKNLPQVHLFGTEKAYGAIEPQDFDKQVKAYSSWAYACSWKNSTSVAKVPLNLFKRKSSETGEEELDQIHKHPILDLINNVNPFSNKFELMTYSQLFLELTGNAYWWVPRNPLGRPTAIWNIPANWMKVVPSKTKFVQGYIMTVPGKGQKVPFDEREIIHFKFPSPLNMYYGSGPLIAGAYSHDLNRISKDWALNFFSNNAEPSGVLQTQGSISEDEYDRLRDRWNKKHRGTKNAGKLAILEGGLEYVKIGSNIKDARLELVTREMRDEILAIFGVPASKLGLVEDVNRANADANDYTYQKETIFPRLILIEEKLNEKLLPMYLDGETDLLIKFENPVPEDNEFRLKEKQTNIQIGMTTIDEERQKEGLEPFNLPETSAPLIPFNLVPAGQPKPSMDSFGNPTDEDKKDDKEDDKEDEKKAIGDRVWKAFVNMTFAQETSYRESVERFFDREHREVMKKLSNFKGFGVKKGIYEELLVILTANETVFKENSEPYIKNSLIGGILLGGDEVGIDINLDNMNIIIGRLLRARAEFVAENVRKGTASMLNEALKEGFENGEGIEKIAGRIDRIYDFSKKFRSRRIAQTEIIGATNNGKLATYEYAGIEEKKWVTARDERVRDSHQIDGQTVGRTEPFTTKFGNTLNYPGDRTSGAPASEIINCRCTVVASFK